MNAKKVLVNTDQDLAFLLSEQDLANCNAFRLQELENQASFAESGTLPRDIGRYSKYDEKAILESFGVRFHGLVPGDIILQYVTLPCGWKKIATDGTNWYKLVDEKGRTRADICFEASLRNRRAHMILKHRYTVDFDFNRSKDGVAMAYLKDCGRIIRKTKPIHLSSKCHNRSEIVNIVMTTAISWLDENLPRWKDPGAYWDCDLAESLKT